jgi:hypothetical protein
MDLPVPRVDRVGRLTAPLEGTAEVLDDQPAARPQCLYQPGQDITALRQMAQNQPGMNEIVASRRDRTSGDIVTGYLELGQLRGRDEPGIDVRSQDASR